MNQIEDLEDSTSSRFSIFSSHFSPGIWRAVVDTMDMEIEDVRQTRKVRYKLKDIQVIVLFAMLANADDWVEMEVFMGLLSPDILQQLYGKW